MRGKCKTITFFKRNLSGVGGGEKYTLAIAKAFAKSGYAVRLISGESPPPSFSFAETIPISLRGSSAQKIEQFDHFCSLFAKNHPDQIFFSLDRTSTQTYLRAGDGVHASYLQRRKKSFSWVNSVHRSVRKLEKKAFESSSLKILFANSEMVRRDLLSHYEIDPNKIKVVHNGVEWKQLEAPFKKWEEVKSSAPFTFLFTGNNFERKGLLHLLEALSLIPNEDWLLDVVGHDKKSSYYQKKAHSLGLEKKVRFFGLQRDVIPFYQRADCLVIPSIYDPFANVTVEALAMGLFVLSSSANGGSEVLSSKTGCVIEEIDNPFCFASSLLYALGKKKTHSQAEQIRQSVSHLDFENQLSLITEVVAKVTLEPKFDDFASLLSPACGSQFMNEPTKWQKREFWPKWTFATTSSHL